MKLEMLNFQTVLHATFIFKAPQRVPHSTSYLKEQTTLLLKQLCSPDYVFVIVSTNSFYILIRYMVHE